MKSKFALLFLIAVVVLTGCTTTTPKPPTITGNPILSDYAIGNVTKNVNDTVYLAAESLSTLPLLDENSFNPDGYKTFADYANYAAKILEEKTGLDMPRLDSTQRGWDKFSKVVTEYAPLVGNYNNLIRAAKNLKENYSESSLNNFYANSTIFGAEVSIIYFTAFADVTYQSVGVLYRASGIQAFAFKCGACISAALTESHWLLRTALVETSSKALESVINITEYIANNGISIQEFENAPVEVMNKISNYYTSLNIKIPIIILPNVTLNQ